MIFNTQIMHTQHSWPLSCWQAGSTAWSWPSWWEQTERNTPQHQTTHTRHKSENTHK